MKRHLGAFLPALLCVVLFGATVFWLVLPETEKAIMAKKKEMIRELAESVSSLLDSYEQQERAGVLSRAEAQRRALARIQAMRYGTDEKNYFWIMDLGTNLMLMHPYLPELIGQDLTDNADAHGFKFYQAMLRVLGDPGAGYVTYTFRYMDQPGREGQKVSYVTRFSPWDWGLGTGVYSEDIQAEMARLTRELTWAGLGVWLAVTLLGLYITVRNVRTDRESQAAQQASLESAQKFQTVSANALDGIIMADGRHRIVFWNRADEEIFGFLAEEALGQNGLELLTPARHRQGYLELFQNFLAAGEGQVAGEILELTARNKQGLEFPVEVSVSALTMGGQPHVVLVVRNITKRKLAETKMAESEKLYRTLFERAGEAIFLVRDNRITDCNAATLTTFGGPRERIVGLSPAALSPARQADGQESEALAAARTEEAMTGRTMVFEWLHQRLDGAVFDAEVSLTRIELGGEAFLLAVVRDISDRKRAEEALRESESRLRQAQSLGGVGSYEIDLASGMVWGSEQAIRIYGLEAHGKDRLPFDLVQSLTLAEDRHRMDQALNQLLNYDAPYQQEYGIRRPSDGQLRRLTSRAEVVRDAQGRPLKMLGTVQDVTERVRAEEEIRRSEATLRGILQASPSGIAMVSYPDRKMAWANERMCEMTGYTLPELLGRPSRSLYFSEEEYRRVGSTTTRELKSKGVLALETTWRTKAGASLEVLINIAALSADELTAGLVFTALDISEAKRAREVVRRSEEKYRLILEAIPDSVVLYDVEGRVVYLNPAFTRVFGWTLAEAQGGRLDYVPEEEWPRTREMLEMMKQGLPHSGFETSRLDKRGNLLNVAMNWSSWRDEQGQLGGSVVVLRDVTEHKKMVAQLEQARKMEAVGNLAGGIAHDFNNVLQAISGNVQLLLMRADIDGGPRATLAGIDNLTQRAAEMIQQLLTISRKREVHLRPLDLNQEIDHICRLLERVIPKMIDIECNLAPDLWLINGDQTQLEQILLNLAGNAADAMPEGGKLIFHTENQEIDEVFCRTHPELYPGAYVLLRVADTGAGMDKETIKHIFEPFFTTKAVGKGTGLGLSTAYGIVNNHLGLITCYSTPGQGTVFNVYLPALADQGAERNEAARLSGEALRGGSETILLVDDEEAILGMGREILGMYGYQVLTAGSGEQALVLYEEQGGGIDLVILDLNMPGMGGQRCLERILGLDPAARVIISSGYYTHVTARDLGEAGAEGFIGKPYRLTDMVRRVREALDKPEAGNNSSPAP